jgi:hypothetical protein
VQVGGEPGVAGQGSAVAAGGGGDEAPRRQVAQQVGVAVGRLQPVVPERDGRQPEAFLGREDHAGKADHAEVTAQDGVRAGPRQLLDGILAAAHLGRPGDGAGAGHTRTVAARAERGDGTRASPLRSSYEGGLDRPAGAGR